MTGPENRHLATKLAELVAALHPLVLRALADAELKNSEFVALSSVERLGKRDGAQRVLPLADLVDALMVARRYKKRAGAHWLISKLVEEKRYLEEFKFTREEKQSLFPGSGGYRNALALTKRGEERLREFDKALANRLPDALSVSSSLEEIAQFLTR